MGYPEYSKAARVKIDDLEFGEPPEEVQPLAQPNPTRITWSRTNDVVVHKIPYPSHKTIRTSKKSLYTLSLEVHTVKKSVFDKLLQKCEEVGPWEVTTAHKKMQMYIIQYSWDEIEGHQDSYAQWKLELQEAND